VPNMHGDTAASGTASKKISAIAPISPLTWFLEQHSL
jgi:hypothetical protein